MANKRIVLREGKHYTLTVLASRLNETYRKKSGALYTPIDVQKYVIRGHLPKTLGGNRLSELRNDIIGLKLVVLHPLKAEEDDNK
ncbi:hypothetical protein EOM86_05780 [Candidatus Nomurabacteria bacterium]|nr:hypothetical protein [Candidatus Nomurabacteria bacterium]